jgi:outer membrane protein assembly factor BamB
MYAFTTYGRPVWVHEIAEDDKDTYYGSSPAIAPDGTVYVGSWDGGLYAFEGDGAPAKTLWPQYRHDAQHTGRVPAK